MEKEFNLKFKCPVAIEDMPDCDGGKFCTQCDKKVFDYSKMKQEVFEERAMRNRDESTCGIYSVSQLTNGFGDWRDSISGWYRKAKKRRIILLLPILWGLLFLVSCGSGRLCGAYAADWDYEEDTLSHKTEVE